MTNCICSIKPYYPIDDNYCGDGPDVIDDNVFIINENGSKTGLFFQVQHNGKYRITDESYKVNYFPKYCPECGRKILFEEDRERVE